MNKAKTLIVYLDSRHHWVSCEYIRKNLIQAYSIYAQNEISLLPLRLGISRDELKNTFLKVIDKDFKNIVFLDARTDYREAIIKIAQTIFPNAGFIYTFHLYGAYVLNYSHWLSLERILDGKSVKFIAASDRHKNLVKSTIKSPEVCHLSPFPINTDHYSFKLDSRTEFRENKKIPDETKVFCYAGRISAQKKVSSLIRNFKKFLEISNSSSILFIAGKDDNLGFGYIGQHEFPGDYLKSIKAEISAYPDWIQKQIVFLGNLDEEELKSLYCGADCFVSLSVFNDEDFGMAPVEALCTGLPLILTDWGGYNSIAQIATPEFCKLVRVKISHRVFVDHGQFIKELLRRFKAPQSKEVTRKEISRLARKFYSIEAVGKRLQNILLKKQGGALSFNSVMTKVQECFDLDNGAPFLKDSLKYKPDKHSSLENPNWELSEFYRKLYSHYIKE